MTHIDMHNALNAVIPKYEQYKFTGRDLEAHPIAATAQAVHDVLVAIYPKQEANLNAELQMYPSAWSHSPLSQTPGSARMTTSTSPPHIAATRA